MNSTLVQLIDFLKKSPFVASECLKVSWESRL